MNTLPRAESGINRYGILTYSSNSFLSRFSLLPGESYRLSCSFQTVMGSVNHDAHARPPDHVRGMFKKWQKTTLEDLDSDRGILDTSSLNFEDRVRECDVLDTSLRDANTACREFLACEEPYDPISQVRCYEVKSLPGGHHHTAAGEEKQ